MLISREPPLIVTLGAFCLLPPVFSEEAATLRAGLGEGSEISGKLAIGVITAAVKGSPLFI